MDYYNTKQYRKISTHGLVFDYRLPLQNLGNYFWGSLFILNNYHRLLFMRRICYFLSQNSIQNKEGWFWIFIKIVIVIGFTHFVRQIVNWNNFLEKSRVFFSLSIIKTGSVNYSAVNLLLPSFLTNQQYWHFYTVLILIRRNTLIEKNKQ